MNNRNKHTKYGFKFANIALSFILSITMCIASIAPAMLVFAEDENPGGQTSSSQTEAAAIIGDVEYESLGEAVADANDGDTIVLLKDVSEFIEVSGKSLTIDLNAYKWTAAESGSSRLFARAADKADLTIKNGTITGGYADYNSPYPVYAEGNSSLTIETIIAESNTGGLIYIDEGTLTIDDSRFENNNIDESGGGSTYIVYSDGASTKTYISNTRFTGNNRPEGGIIYQMGAYNKNQSKNELHLKSCDLDANVVGTAPLWVTYNGRLFMDDTTITQNTAVGTFAGAGGLKLDSGWLDIKDSAIYGNSVSSAHSYADDASISISSRSGLLGGSFPMPQDMKDHGKALTGYRMMSYRYGYEHTEAITQSTRPIYSELTIEPDATDEIVEYNGRRYSSFAKAVKAMNGNPGRINLLKDVSLADSFEGHEGIVIDLQGHTISGLKDNTPALSVKGGSVTILAGTFKDCKDGAIQADEADVMLTGLTFENCGRNVVNIRHHIDVVNKEDSNPCSAVIRGCTFRNNEGNESMPSAYAVSIYNCSAEVERCTFEGNFGGLNLSYSHTVSNPAEAYIGESTFTGHKGNALNVVAAKGNKVDVRDCSFTGNSIESAKGDHNNVISIKGAEWYNIKEDKDYKAGGETTLRNCEISGNSGSLATVQTGTGTQIFRDCTISGNSATDVGGVLINQKSKLSIIDTVIKENKAEGNGPRPTGGVKVAATYNYVGTGGGLAGDAGISYDGYEIGSINFESGAIYNNSTASPDGVADLFVMDKKSIVKVLDPEEMKDGDFDFTDKVWSNVNQGKVVDKADIDSDLEKIYIYPLKGLDTNEGTRANPVKTWERATEMLKEKGRNTIVVMGTVNFKEKTALRLMSAANTNEEKQAQTIDLGGAVVERDKDHDGYLFTIQSGASVILQNTTIDGKNYPAKNPMIRVDGGGELTLGNGAELINNGGATHHSGGGGGLGVYGHANIEEGSRIAGNTALEGAGIYAYGGTVVMNGGVIEKNHATAARSEKLVNACGGGVMLHGGAEMVLNGGDIIDNIAESDGGGIALGDYYLDEGSLEINGKLTGSLKMNGGNISRNVAKSAGGGIFVQVNSVANITGGYITANDALGEAGRTLHAGGGIYVNGYHNNSLVENGKLYLANVEFANNSAAGEGGAIAWCGSGSGSANEVNGTVIYDNISYGDYLNVKTITGHETEYSKKNVDILVDNLAWTFDREKDNSGGDSWSSVVLAERINKVVISNRMLNGASYNWTDENGEAVSEEQLNNVNKKLRLTTKATKDDEAVQKSLKLASVHIVGNYSDTNGGGIASNGDVYIGKTPEEVQGEYEPPGENPEESVKGVSEEESGKVKGAYKSKSANTGDDSDIIFLLLVTLFAAAAFSTMAIRRRRG